MPSLMLHPDNVHDMHVNGRHVLFHVPTTGIFHLDELGSELLALFKSEPELDKPAVHRQLGDQFPRLEIDEILEEFASLDIIGDGSPGNQQPAVIDKFPLSTIILNVNTGCNLSCTYCYKEDLTDAASGERMEFETARKSVDLLLRECGERERVNIVFFGGEPLTNLPLIKQVVVYAEKRCGELHTDVDFSLTTNATMLTEEIVDYFNEHAFGITVSIDGPKAIHDKNRITTSGKGTYDVVRRKIEMLLSRYNAKPVGARVTLTRGVTDILEIHRHLKEDLGFFEVGFAPVTA
ncbi:MAG: quinohemoprotein amine dehydrogenase maturase, partial [Gammaproteobacteria bacterium]